MLSPNGRTSVGALDWMRGLKANESSRWLFRGQNREFPSIKPSLARLPPESQTVGYNICRCIHRVAHGIAGYALRDTDAELALLQHYFGVSPVIDLTGTPEVALFFAMSNAAVGAECVVYALDRTAVQRARIVEHDFLMLPLDAGGVDHRWLKQDGYGIIPSGWPDLDAVRSFDMLECYPHDQPVGRFLFTKTEADEQYVWNSRHLLSLDGDPLPRRMRDVIEALVVQHGLVLTPSLEARLRDVFPRSPTEELLAKIAALQGQAAGLGLDGVVRELGEVEVAVRGRLFDTAWNCTLAVLTERVLAASHHQQ